MEREAKKEVERLLGEGRKSEAINYVRDRFEVSVRDATRLVETLEAGGREGPAPDNRDPLPAARRVGCLSTALALWTLMSASIAGWFFYRQSVHIAGSDLVPGTVVAMVESSDGESEALAPVVKYNWKGQSRTYYSNTYTYPPAYEVNDTLDLYVNRTDPERIYINSFSDRWLVIVIFGGMATITGSIAFALIRRAGTNNPNKP